MITPTPMIVSTDRQLRLVSWGASIFLHACLLIFGAALVLQPVRFHVEPGKASTEFNFAIELVPVPVSAPPARTPPLPPPAPVPSAPLPSVLKPEAATISEPLVSSSPAATAIAPLPAPAKTVAKPKATLARHASRAAQGSLQAQPDALHNEPPVYPEEAQDAGERGMVILRIEVTAAGTPAEIRILQSSGYVRLDQAARQAVQHWRFHPAMTAGLAVSSEVDAPVRFQLQ